MTSQGSSGVATDIRFRILQILRPSTPKKKKLFGVRFKTNPVDLLSKPFQSGFQTETETGLVPVTLKM
jgi:hypothetical protein